MNTELISTDAFDEADIEMQLSLQASKGDLSGFDETYRRFFPRIQHMISHKFGENPPSEDIAQDAFVKAYAAIEERKFGYQGPHSLYGWLSTIAINRALDIRRRHMRIAMVPVDFSEGYYDRPAPNDFTEDIAATDCAVTMLSALTPERREAIIAIDIRGEKYEEYAGDSGVNIGTVRSRIHRGRNDLRQNFEQQDPAE